MDHSVFFKEMINFNKLAFDNSFKAMTLLQEQTEQISSQLLEKAVWLPEDGKKAVNEWAQTFKKGRDQYKEAMDQNFAKLQQFFPVKD